jgi:hypothetical protein
MPCRRDLWPVARRIIMRLPVVRSKVNSLPVDVNANESFPYHTRRRMLRGFRNFAWWAELHRGHQMPIRFN